MSKEFGTMPGLQWSFDKSTAMAVAAVTGVSSTSRW